MNKDRLKNAGIEYDPEGFTDIVKDDAEILLHLVPTKESLRTKFVCHGTHADVMTMLVNFLASNRDAAAIFQEALDYFKESALAGIQIPQVRKNTLEGPADAE